MVEITLDAEMIRKAVKWISDERLSDSSKKNRQLIGEAALHFNLSPKEVEYLDNFLKNDID